MTLDKLREAMQRWRRPWATGSEPMELRRSVLEDVEGKVFAAGGGRRVFPFNRILVHLRAEGAEERTMLEAIVREGWDLETEIAARFADLDCPPPPDLAVAVDVTEEDDPAFGDRRWRVAYERAEPVESAIPEPLPTGGRPILDLTIVEGKATQQVYSPAGDRIHLGRLKEVVDSDGRVQRRNEVAFLEEGEVCSTVSREHARITWDEAAGAFFLRDEGSAYGTRILRGGRPIEVSASDRRGVRLQTGDEIYLGRARLKVALRPREE